MDAGFYSLECKGARQGCVGHPAGARLGPWQQFPPRLAECIRPQSIRVPAVYPKLAFWAFLAYLPFHEFNKLRTIRPGTGFESPQVHHLTY